MGMQLVIHGCGEDELTEALAGHGVACEIFSMPNGSVGISIPTRVVEAIGEPLMERIIGSFTYTDMWSGHIHQKIMDS